jgi:hypothetical protein
MPVSDKKKCQSLINEIGLKVQQLQVFVARLKVLRTAYQDQSVDPTGTPLEGNVTAVSTWIDDLETLATSAIATGMVAAIVPSHRGTALGV